MRNVGSPDADRPVETLDALHLATAAAIGGDAVVTSHDDNLTRMAEVLGLTSFEPLSDHESSS